MISKRRQLAAGTLVGAAAAGAALVAATLLGVASAAPGGAPSDTGVVVGFSALSDRGLPAAPASVVAEARSLHPGSYDSLREVGPGMYFGENAGALCLFVVGGLGGCTDRLNAGDVWLAGDMVREYDSPAAPFRVHLYGVARDGVASIDVVTPHGMRAIRTRRNAFEAVLGNTAFDDIRGIAVVYRSGERVNVDPARYFPRLLKR